VEELELVWMWCGNCIDLVWCGCNRTKTGSSNGLTSTRYCKYSCTCSWRWVEITPETCRTVFQK
jgi:hypothetical protein